MNQACAAGILAGLREVLDKDWLRKVGEPGARDRVVQTNVLLGLTELWRDAGHDDVDILALATDRLNSICARGYENPVFCSGRSPERTRLYALTVWAECTLMFIRNAEVEAIPLQQRVDACVEILNKIFPLWPFVVRRAWCREGRSAVAQVFDYMSYDACDKVEARVAQMLGGFAEVRGYSHWSMIERGLYMPRYDDDPVRSAQVAKATGRLLWKAVQGLRAKLLAEVGGPPPPEDLKPPIPSVTHDYRQRLVFLLAGPHGAAIQVANSGGVWRAWVDISVPYDRYADDADVIPGDRVILSGVRDGLVGTATHVQPGSREGSWSGTLSLTRPAK